MIQRIQTVYLLISTLILVSLFVLPIAEIAKDGSICLFNSSGIIQDGIVKQSGILISVLLGFIILMQGYAISRFKNRKQQINIIYVAIIGLLALLSTFAYFTYVVNGGAQISFKISAIFPLIAIILDYMAIRAIGKDEALIRSIDRIR